MTDIAAPHLPAFVIAAFVVRKSPVSRADPSYMTLRNTARAASIGLFLSLVGCANDAGNGALIGGGVGALAGGIIGHQSGHAAGGALIGGGVGALAGGLIGHASDENKIEQRKQYDRGYADANYDDRYARPAPAPASGYYSSTEVTRTSVGNGGYRNSRTVTETSSSTTYYR